MLLNISIKRNSVHLNVNFNSVFLKCFRTIKVEVYDWDRDGR